MATTSRQLIDAVAKAVKDPTFMKRDKDTFAQILTDAQDYLTDQLEPLIKIDSTSITLVADQIEYNLPTDFIKFETRQSNMKNGYVALGTYRDVPLNPASQGALDTYRPKWRNTTSGTPSEFFIDNISGANTKLGIWPPPSSTFITDFGSTCWIRYVSRSAALAYDSSTPFDNSDRLRSLFYLIKLHSIWQISLEDVDVAKADRFEAILEKRMEQAKDVIESTLIMPSAVGFTPFGKNIL